MTLQERVTQHPELVFYGCVVWILLAFWVMSLVGWMVQAEIDPLFGLTGIFVAIALGYLTMNPPKPQLTPSFFFAVLGTMVAYPFLRKTLNKRELEGIDIEAIENAYEMLLIKPDNSAAKFKLAGLLYHRGHPGPAVAIGTEAIQAMPEGLFPDEHKMLDKWRRMSPAGEATKPIACLECGTQNPPNALTCQKCGARHLLAIAKGNWVGREFAKKVLGAWVAGIITLAGIPLAATLPPSGAIPIIVVLMIGALLLVWFAFAGRGNTRKA